MAEWDLNQTYNATQQCTYSGVTYISLSSLNRGHVPPSYPVWWLQVQSSGGGGGNTVVAGTGISVSTVDSTSTVSNTGVLSLKHNSTTGLFGDIVFSTPGAGIGIDDTTTSGVFAFTNAGITSLSSSDPEGSWTVRGDAILTGGTGIDVTGGAQTLTVTNTGVLGVQANGGTAQTGTLNMAAGDNVTITESNIAGIPTFLFSSGGSDGAGVTLITSLTPGTFNVSYTLAYLNFVLSGGGGGGSGGMSLQSGPPYGFCGGAGGGSGTIVSGCILCSAGDVFSYAIGAGGSSDFPGTSSTLQHGALQPMGSPALDSVVIAPGGSAGNPNTNTSGLVGGRGGSGGVAGTPGFTSVSYGGGGGGPLSTATAGGASTGSLTLDGTAGLPLNDIGIAYGGSGGMCPLAPTQCINSVNPGSCYAAGGQGGGSRGGLGSASILSPGFVGDYGGGGGGGCGSGTTSDASTTGGPGGRGFLVYWYTIMTP